MNQQKKLTRKEMRIDFEGKVGRAERLRPARVFVRLSRKSDLDDFEIRPLNRYFLHHSVSFYYKDRGFLYEHD